ncbi:MAG: hypothetical protein GWP60_13220 [Gammaproteobacteria bacterium]|jgi:hypothetical protein|nr:hypothetical protein [Gammaproteobacteria bacterium]
MNNNASALLLLIGSIFPAAVLAADAQDIIDKVLELDEERRKGVNRYVVEQEVMGQVSTITFERTTVTGPDGTPVETFRMVLPDDMLQPDPGSEPVMSQDDFEDMAQEAVYSIAAFSESAELVGTETVDGHEAYHLVAENLERTRSFAEAQEFTLQTVNVWIDTEYYVPRRMVMDGTMDTDGTPRPVTIETIERDYREVPGSNMYEPYQQVMRLTGEMADETKRQMEEAREALAEFDKQLAEMPESQRQMMMNMMGEQMEMMRKMAAGDGIEIVTDVRSITVE